jgi:cell division protein FtsI (penicillin-binding protein 3)
MSQQPSKKTHDRRRPLTVALFLIALFTTLIVQFYRIQIIQGEKWHDIALSQHFFLLTEPFVRGSFFSNGSVKKKHPDQSERLVYDIQKFHLNIDPLSIPPECRLEISQTLLKLLGKSSKKVFLDNLLVEMGKNTHYRRLATWLDPEVCDSVRKWWIPYAKAHKIPRNALFFTSDHQRSYPYGAMLGQVLHTIRRERESGTKQGIPTGGLELQFNPFLKGSLGKRRLMRSPRHQLETDEVFVLPKNGADVYLTINHVLQSIVEEQLKVGVEAAKARSGWAVMMNPHTGEILALAQYPFFDPTEYESFFNNPQKMEDTKVKAITDAQELGSVMKPITVAIALHANEVLKARGEKPLFDPLEPMPTANGSFPGRKPLTEVTVHKQLNMYQALQKSSNIYSARLIQKVVERLGNEWYRDALTEIFGFGQMTGIELPGESPGVVPKPGRKVANGRPEWSTPTPFSLAIGYSLQVNSLQLLRAYSLFANGGKLVKPTLVRKISKKRADGTEEIIFEADFSKVETSKSLLGAEVIAEVVKGLKYATKTGGCARRADVPGYTEAGKSGTARKLVAGNYSNKHHLSSFVGFAPANDPVFILLVSLNEPEVKYTAETGHTEHGGYCSAPIFREIAVRALPYLGVAPDDPYGYPAGDPRRDAAKADWLKEVKDLSELYNKWNK